MQFTDNSNTINCMPGFVPTIRQWVNTDIVPALMAIIVRNTMRGDKWAETCKININISNFVKVEISVWVGNNKINILKM